MTRTQKLLRLLSTALIAALVAGGVANTILSATPLQAAGRFPICGALAPRCSARRCAWERPG